MKKRFKNDDYLVRKESTVVMYSELWHASGCLLEKAIENSKRSSWLYLSSIIMSAFTFEAYLNHINDSYLKIKDKINEFEEMSPINKLIMVSKELKIESEFDKSRRPFQTIKSLYKFRNFFAHGKSLKMYSEYTTSQSKVNYETENYPKNEWIRKIEDSKFAELVREDIDKSIRIIHSEINDVDKGEVFSFGYNFVDISKI